MLRLRHKINQCYCGTEFSIGYENESTYYCKTCGLPNPKFITGLQCLKHEDINFPMLYGNRRPLTWIINLVQDTSTKKKLIDLLKRRAKTAKLHFYRHKCMFCKYGFDGDGYGYDNALCSQECLDFCADKYIRRNYFKE